MLTYSVRSSDRLLHIHYAPVLVWSFALMVLVGIGDIVSRLLDGRLTWGIGTLGAIVALVGFALFTLLTGGQFVRVVFDRDADTIRLYQYGVRGLQTTRRRISDLSGLDVRILRRAQHRIELRFRSGERLPITPYYIVSLRHQGLKRISALLRMEPTLIQAPAKW
jgi:hypothetical protein